MTLNTSPENLSSAGPSGTVFGQSAADIIGFYGVATPVAQRTSAAQSALTLITGTTGGYGFTTLTGFSAMCAQVSEIAAMLTALGLWKGS